MCRTPPNALPGGKQVGVVAVFVDELRDVPTLRDDRPAGGAHVVEGMAHQLGAETLLTHGPLDHRVREDEVSPCRRYSANPTTRPSRLISYRERSSLRVTSMAMLEVPFECSTGSLPENPAEIADVILSLFQERAERFCNVW